MNDIYDLYIEQCKISALFSKAVTLQNNSKKLHEALEIYRKILDLEPNHWGATHNLGLIYDDLGDQKQAIIFLKKSIELDPNNYLGYFNLGYIYYSMGEFEKSLSYYLEAKKINHDDKFLLNNLGTVYYHLKNDEESLYYYNLCSSKYFSFYKPFYNRGLIYGRQKNLILEIESYTGAIQLEPSDYSSYVNRGACYMQIEQYGDALKDFRKAVKLRYPKYKSTELASIHKAESINWVVAFETLLTAGFFPVPVIREANKYIIIYPSGNERIILKPENTHISKTNKRHLRQYEGRYELKLNADFNAIIDRLDFHYKDKDESYYLWKLKNIYPLINKYSNSNSIRYITVALYLDGRLVSGDVGIISKKLSLYQSLTGYHDAPCAGSVLLVLLSRELVKLGISLIDLGGSTPKWDQYKLRLGAQEMCIEEYQKLFFSLNPDSVKIFNKKNKRRNHGTFD